MCSIIGYYRLLSTAKPNPRFVNQGLDLMRHRGPDAEAYKKYNQGVCLGGQRLSIIDVKSRANQPMDTTKSNFVYNGEIYNYLELKKDLEKKTKFKTTSDTEVLQKGLEIEGSKFLNKTNGMFALAQYFSKGNKIIIARDRFGVKPLYYMVQDDVLYFSSEMRPLIKIKNGLKRNLSYYQSFIVDTATDYDKNTFIDGIFQVPPGFMLKAEKKKIKLQKWYFGKDFQFDQSTFKSKSKTLDFVEDLLTDAIKLRLRSDVPVSISLSGGLDSSVIYTLIKERISQPITPFTIIHNNSPISEKMKVKKLVSNYHDKAISINYDSKKDITSKIKTALYFTEFPIWDPSLVVYFELYKQIRQRKFKVVIEGHGSDEQLGGYSYMVESAIKEMINSNHHFSAIKLTQNYLEMNPYGSETNLINKLLYLYVASKGKQKSFQKIVEESFDYKILPIVLRTFDRMTMANGIEGRAPFMDYRLVEVFRKLPLKYKVDSSGSKTILRAILKKYHKDYIYKDKRKIGFGMDLLKLTKNSQNKRFFKSNLKKFSIDEYQELKNEALQKINSQKFDNSELPLVWKIASLGFIDEQFGLNN